MPIFQYEIEQHRDEIDDIAVHLAQSSFLAARFLQDRDNLLAQWHHFCPGYLGERTLQITEPGHQPASIEYHATRGQAARGGRCLSLMQQRTQFRKRGETGSTTRPVLGT